MADLTVVVTTSPVHSNPSTKMLEALFDSFGLVDGLAGCPKLVVFDGYNVGNKPQYRAGRVTQDDANDYEQYCAAALELMGPEGADGGQFANTTGLRLPKRVGFAHAVKAGLELVDTKFVMVVQHDLAFVQGFPLRAVLAAMTAHRSRLNYVGLPGAKHLHLEHPIRSKYKLTVAPTSEFGSGLVLLPLIYWYDKTHIVHTDFYRDFVYGGGAGVEIPFGQFTEHTYIISKLAPSLS